ncbi:PDZ and LIM domain protein 7 isoform X2 [Nematostella vectensis]|uniref:PDZ and LIM domain protein 7 isoform X2 n=1 Tax=Nematostella vectensis TaxID=45351 RepID=UPI0020771F78|nr:PDZ and LIM domain protein 7 isoform X2 [Nematostella vectensis]
MAGQEFALVLDGGGPWGFRLKGGKDFGQIPTVSQLTPGGKAITNGLRVEDQILSINGMGCEDMTHMEAQESIKRTGNALRLQVRRGATGSPSMSRKPLTMTSTTHSAGADHKYNAIPKPFGATSYQAPARPPAVQAAPSVRIGPPTASKPQHYQHGPPAPPPAPSYSQQQYSHQQYSPQPQGYGGGAQYRDQVDSDAAMRAKKKEIEDEMLAQRFKMSISDDGEVSYDGDEVPSWGHPPDPNVQSKSFKRLMKHLEKAEPEDDLPPPPPEAFMPGDEDGGSHVQSKSFQMLSRAVDSGETPPSVFSRAESDRSKPSTTPMPLQRPHAPVVRPSHEPLQAPPPPMATRPGQPAPVGLPGMVRMEPAKPPPSQPPSRGPPQRSPGYQGSPAPPGPSQEIRRQPAKPPQPRDGPRTPYCDACGEEILGPFVSAIGKSWHPDHFTCAGCGDSLQNQGFIEEGGKLYCEKDYNKFFAPHCESCKQPIVGPCVQAIGKTFHSEHFTCSSCSKQIGSEGFNVDRGMPYCEMCYKKLFCVKCAGCNRAIGGGDRWVEAIDVSWHATCFKCSTCNKLLEGSQFYAYGGKPFCVLHGAP